MSSRGHGICLYFGQVFACTSAKLHACTITIVLACTLVKVHARTMAKVHACALAIVLCSVAVVPKLSHLSNGKSWIRYISLGRYFLYQTASNNHVWFTDKLEYANHTSICQSTARSAGWCDRQSTDVYLYKTAFQNKAWLNDRLHYQNQAWFFFQARDWRMNVGRSLQPCSVAVGLKTICNASSLRWSDDKHAL